MSTAQVRMKHFAMPDPFGGSWDASVTKPDQDSLRFGKRSLEIEWGFLRCSTIYIYSINKNIYIYIYIKIDIYIYIILLYVDHITFTRFTRCCSLDSMVIQTVTRYYETTCYCMLLYQWISWLLCCFTISLFHTIWIRG